MRIALAQMNSVLGNFSKNSEKIISAVDAAKNKNCQLVIFPELALYGYSPSDLLERDDLLIHQNRELQKIRKKIPKGISALVGCVTSVTKQTGKPFYNSVQLLGAKEKLFHKTLLPSYDVFDETRFFQPGDVKKNLFTINGHKILVLICEDIWCWDKDRYENILKSVKSSKPDVVVSINASPFAYGKQKRRHEMVKKTATYFKCPVIYVNMVGGQDELIFDGCSFVMDKKGSIIAQSAAFNEDLNIIDIEKLVGGVRIIPKVRAKSQWHHESLVLGIRDFADKNGIKKVHLGLSGGIDSAVVACLAADALGPMNVATIAMPGPYNADKSLTLAKTLAKNIGCEFSELPINPIYDEQIKSFESIFGHLDFGLVHENLQARIRGSLLMMYGNDKSSMLLNTSNKSELATGYSTLYGDLCGGLAPIADLLKKDVYELASYYNKNYELIPSEIMTRAPSAELSPNQKDEDSLPPYEELDKAVDNIVTKGKSARTSTEKWLLKKIAQSEFKRWQAPPILKVTEHSFGRGRRWPISHQSYL